MDLFQIDMNVILLLLSKLRYILYKEYALKWNIIHA